MPEYLTIKERIERLIAQRVEAIEGIVRVERWNAVKENPGGHMVAIIVPGDEDTQHDAEGGDHGATDINTLPIAIEVEVFPSPQETRPAASIHNELLGLLAAAVLTDINLVDEFSESLTLDVRKAGSANPRVEPDRGSFLTILDIEVTYETFRHDLTYSPTTTQRPDTEGPADGQ